MPREGRRIRPPKNVQRAPFGGPAPEAAGGCSGVAGELVAARRREDARVEARHARLPDEEGACHMRKVPTGREVPIGGRRVMPAVYGYASAVTSTPWRAAEQSIA